MCVEAVIFEPLPIWEVLSKRVNPKFDIEKEWIEFPFRDGVAGLYNLL
jgi:hypothetical protein